MGDENFRKELKDILLCFLEDNNRAKEDASYCIADGRYCTYNENALSDAIEVLIDLYNR